MQAECKLIPGEDKKKIKQNGATLCVPQAEDHENKINLLQQKDTSAISKIAY